VEHHIEEELRLFQAEEGLEEDKMAGTADRQKFGQPLNNTEKDGLNETNIDLRKNLPSLGGRGLRGGGIEPYSPPPSPSPIQGGGE